MAKRLENVGAAAIMPLAAPIGSGLGIQNKIKTKRQNWDCSFYRRRLAWKKIISLSLKKNLSLD